MHIIHRLTILTSLLSSPTLACKCIPKIIIGGTQSPIQARKNTAHLGLRPGELQTSGCCETVNGIYDPVQADCSADSISSRDGGFADFAACCTGVDFLSDCRPDAIERHFVA
ncbi:hypothetical protein F5Y18DRAFT_396621 [Xylariaceae sp. FL1019]|nr:hypothetical protein F5Y18DRAFT_396621 [Xylariaceae sp. FL1019]